MPPAYHHGSNAATQRKAACSEAAAVVVAPLRATCPYHYALITDAKLTQLGFLFTAGCLAASLGL